MTEEEGSAPRGCVIALAAAVVFWSLVAVALVIAYVYL